MKKQSKISEYSFLFSELVKRDFKKKYKSTLLGLAWSMISPLLSLAVMSLVFTHIFGRETEHYTIYLFTGNIIFSFFSDATGGGMGSLLGNADIFSKINVPKYLFLLSRIVSSVINFGLTLLIFAFFCIIEGIVPSPTMLLAPIPVILVIAFSVGVALMLSVLFVFFRDMQYLWSIFTMLLMYLSAIFYTTDELPHALSRLLYLNPLYVYISFMRSIIINGVPPSATVLLLSVFYALASVIVGVLLYNRADNKLLYYV